MSRPLREHYSSGSAEWKGRKVVLFPEKPESFKGKARVITPGLLIYEAGGGDLMITLWLKVVTLFVTVKAKLTIRKAR